MVRTGQGGTPPFAAAAFRATAIPGAVDRTTGRPVQAPAELERARIYDAILQRYPGYTLASLDEADAGVLLPMIALVTAEKPDAV